MPEIDRILRKTITDPVGQGFMAHCHLVSQRERNTGAIVFCSRRDCSRIVVVRLSKTLDRKTSESNFEN
jgi:RNase P/RNase MRP subunit POP5